MEKGEERQETPEKAAPEDVTCEACGAANTEADEVCRGCGEELWEEVDDEEGAPEGWKPLIVGGALAAIVLVLFLWKPWAAKPVGEGGAAGGAATGPFNEIHDVRQDGDLVWIATSGGAFAYDRKTLEQKVNKTDGLLHTFIDALFVDRKGVKWLGTFGGGVNFFDGNEWGKHEPPTTKGATVITIYQDSKDNLWFATDAAGVYKFDGTTWTQYSTKEGLPHDSTHAVMEDKDGSIWVGTTGGVAHLKDGKWKVYRTEDGLVNDHVLLILVDQKGDKWFGTWAGGMSRFDGTTWTTYRAGPAPGGLSSEYVLSGKMDTQGRLWFGTYDGVTMWDGTQFTHFKEADGLRGTDVWATEIDSDGYKWFGTYKGVSRLDPEGKEWKYIVQ